MLHLLTRTPVIIASGIAMLVIGWSFTLVVPRLDGPLLDMIANGLAAEARLAEMNAAQREAHFWVTILNDTAYPLAYGAFFAGLAGRLAPSRWQGFAMMPALFAVVFDYVENTVQALALGGVANLLWTKSLLTPVKFSFLLLAVLLVIVLAIAALVRRARRRA